MTTMLVNPEGVRYLAEDRLLPQLADCFSNIDEVRVELRHGAILQEEKLTEVCREPLGARHRLSLSKSESTRH